jgi:hypothetical protein
MGSRVGPLPGPFVFVRAADVQKVCHSDRSSRGNDGIPSPRLRAKTALIEQPIRFPLLYLTCKRKRNGLCNGRLTSSLCDMIKVSETDVWSHSTTLAPDLHGAACEVVSEFAV